MSDAVVAVLRERARETARKLAKLDGCRSVILIGSVADGHADDRSDIDLVVLYDTEPSERAIAKSLGADGVSKFWFDEYHFHANYKGGKVHGTPLFTPAPRLEKLVEDYPDVSFDDYAELSRYIVNGILMYGDQAEFTWWQDRCRRVPEEMKNETIRKAMGGLKFHFKSGHLGLLVERGDWIMVNRTIDTAVLDILRIVYLLNDQIMIKPKRARSVLEGFERVPERLADRLEGLYERRNTPDDARRKIDQVAEIVDEVEALWGGPKG